MCLQTSTHHGPLCRHLPATASGASACCCLSSKTHVLTQCSCWLVLPLPAAQPYQPPGAPHQQALQARRLQWLWAGITFEHPAAHGLHASEAESLSVHRAVQELTRLECTGTGLTAMAAAVPSVPPLLQSVVTYTAAGPTTNGKTVLANCQVSCEQQTIQPNASHPP